jgi:hypothetical protein
MAGDTSESILKGRRPTSPPSGGYQGALLHLFRIAPPGGIGAYPLPARLMLACFRLVGACVRCNPVLYAASHLATGIRSARHACQPGTIWRIQYSHCRLLAYGSSAKQH